MAYTNKNINRRPGTSKPGRRKQELGKGNRHEGKGAPARRGTRGERPDFRRGQASGFKPQKRTTPDRDVMTKETNAAVVSFEEQQAAYYFPSEAQTNLLFGRNPIREAIKANRDIEKLLVANGDLSGSAREIVSLAKNAGIIIQNVDKVQLDRLAPNHQGLIAFVSAYAYAQVDDMFAEAEEREEQPFLVILDKVTDPQNLGAIIRSAACFGVHGVIVQLHRAVGLTPAAVKASAGAVEHVKVARVTNINQTIQDLKKRNVWIYGADTSGGDIGQVRFDGACALVIGSEGEGISKLTRRYCDVLVSIPMTGRMDSLNASVAAGILMHTVYSKRKMIGVEVT
ncbi:MAG: 23S rRNA (guanosine(2251)-2'-O)-methyltransferase RlmB [Christensenellales bacterium]|jgi:23S rRNA (guanosine2251-2'-O)-methyltransferase